MNDEASDLPVYLTRSQAMRLESRNALPAIDPLLEALERAAACDALPESHRRTLRRTATGFRGVCRPEVPEVLPDERCWRCPPGSGDLATMGLGHTGTVHRIYLYLLRAGLADCAQIAATPTAALSAIPLLGAYAVAAIRDAVPYEGEGK